MAESVPAPSLKPSGERSRSGSQSRRRVRQGIGVFDEKEWRIFATQYERYRKSVAASEYGDSVSAFIRWSTIGEGTKRQPRKRTPPDLPREVVERLGGLMLELTRQGNNLNQIAKRTHLGRRPESEILLAALAENRETLKTIRRVLGWE